MADLFGRQRDMRKLIGIFRKHPLQGSLFLVALGTTVFFAVRTASFAIYWSDPAHRDLELQGWMTPRYVAHSWRVPREVMQDVIGPLPEDTRPTLEAIAEDQGIQLNSLIEQVDAAIAAHREATAE